MSVLHAHAWMGGRFAFPSPAPAELWARACQEHGAPLHHADEPQAPNGTFGTSPSIFLSFLPFPPSQCHNTPRFSAGNRAVVLGFPCCHLSPSHTPCPCCPCIHLLLDACLPTSPPCSLQATALPPLALTEASQWALSLPLSLRALHKVVAVRPSHLVLLVFPDVPLHLQRTLT